MHLQFSLPAKLGLIYLVSEVALRFMRRSDAHSKRRDGNSLLGLWLAIGLGMGGAIAVAYTLPAFSFPLPTSVAQFVGTLFACGLILRWWAILSLGKFFTVDVAILPDHELIVRGPYHVLRHPSYSGMMLAFVMLSVTFQNWLSIVCLMLPVSIALAYRIYIEEIALEATFGDAYHTYSKATKRLIPGVF